jgi:hypothetical protein
MELLTHNQNSEDIRAWCIRSASAAHDNVAPPPMSESYQLSAFVEYVDADNLSIVESIADQFDAWRATVDLRDRGKAAFVTLEEYLHTREQAL